MTVTAIQIAAESAKALQEIAELQQAVDAALLPAIEAAKLRNDEIELRQMAALLPAESTYAQDLLRAAELAATNLPPLGQRPSTKRGDLNIGDTVVYSDNYITSVGEFTKSADAAIGMVVGMDHFDDAGKRVSDTASVSGGFTYVQVRWTWKDYSGVAAERGDGVHIENLSKVA